MVQCLARNRPQETKAFHDTRVPVQDRCSAYGNLLGCSQTGPGDKFFNTLEILRAAVRLAQETMFQYLSKLLAL